MQSPIAVGALLLLAIGYMAWTFWPKGARKIFTDPSQAILEVTGTARAPTNETVQDEAPVVEAVPVDADFGPLGRIGWKRLGNRDPFAPVKRKGAVAGWLAGGDSALKLAASVATPPKVEPKPAHAPKAGAKTVTRGNAVAPKTMTLQAIAVGPGGRLALVNGKWFKQGSKLGLAVVESVQPDTVWLRIGQQLKPLAFEKGR